MSVCHHVCLLHMHPPPPQRSITCFDQTILSSGPQDSEPARRGGVTHRHIWVRWESADHPKGSRHRTLGGLNALKDGRVLESDSRWTAAHSRPRSAGPGGRGAGERTGKGEFTWRAGGHNLELTVQLLFVFKFKSVKAAKSETNSSGVA